MKLCTLAICLALASIPVGIGLALTGGVHAPLFYLFAVPAAMAVLAGAFAIASVVRKERPVWLSVVALVVSFGPAIALASAVFLKKHAEEQYQNDLAKDLPAQVMQRPGGEAR